MAGCLPEYLPVVIAGVEAMCDEAFDLLGVSGTTDAVAPVFVNNGPVRRALDINCGAGALGPGWRANATIGRALRLVWVNVGGALPGVISMSTFGNPGRYACCFGENEEASGWEPLSVEHGFAPEDSTIAVLAGEPLQIVNDTQSRRAPDLLTTIARSLEVVAHHRATALGDILVLLGPEHARTIAEDGLTKARARQLLWELCRVPAEAPDAPPTAKFRTAENLKLVVAGGTAGRFSALIPGWPFPNAPTQLVLKKIRLPV
jgi:hypothetical protein